jgi:hypothetical protein
MTLKERIRTEMVTTKKNKPMKFFSKLRLDPIHIDKHNWYYEEAKGIWFVHEVHDKEGNYIQTDHYVISWKILLESIKRKYGPTY